MNDAERLELVLEELRELLHDLADLAEHVVLVGGQVLAVESRARGGDGVIKVETGTGVCIDRGYSFEPDLVFDTDAAGARSEMLTDVLRARGYQRVRQFRWSKDVGNLAVLVDLFVPENADSVYLPTGMTALPGGSLALARPRRVVLSVTGGDLRIALPDPRGFVATKLEAKLRLRPAERKDSFDIYAYVKLRGAGEVIAALAGAEGRRLAAELRELFADEHAPGVQDVLAYAGNLSPEERALVVRDVIDLFARVWRGCHGSN